MEFSQRPEGLVAVRVRFEARATARGEGVDHDRHQRRAQKERSPTRDNLEIGLPEVQGYGSPDELLEDGHQELTVRR